jgi:hypothetical protein
MTTEISNSKDDSNNMTTHNSRNAGRVYIMVSCAAPEGVFTQRPVYFSWRCLLYRGEEKNLKFHINHYVNAWILKTKCGSEKLKNLLFGGRDCPCLKHTVFSILKGDHSWCIVSSD